MTTPVTGTKAPLVLDRADANPAWDRAELLPVQGGGDDGEVDPTDWDNDPFFSLCGIIEGGPGDLAHNLDHYLYGAPRVELDLP